jgi:hypothetical protein
MAAQMKGDVQQLQGAAAGRERAPYKGMMHFFGMARF